MIKEKNIVFLLISSTIVTFAWIVFSIYYTYITSTLDTRLTEQIKPIQSPFNPRSIDAILSRQSVAPTYEMVGNKPIVASESSDIEIPTPTVSEPPLEEENL